ncbi:D-glycero-alpha-D-manno-heptose-1,7-bisphosphate 7-phosphatase [Sorangium cellulosum]|uniref:D-glycero-alpha-D-manno-heptose-1,7-bisphosphate 7-phosphatase n=1 Tax=Sorangium cellulosum TaxID=56 RepID=UPI0010111757|nr:HAD-IIIA family hydrolase [Sorangium cellulosum]
MSRRRGVVLDRDGTLIDVVRDVELGVVVTAFHPDQIRLLPGVLEGLRRLADAGFLLAIATNQPGAAKGQVPLAAIERTNRALVERLREAGVAIAALAVCPHHPEGGPGGDPALIGPCACRKPAPGMLTALARELDLDASASWMIGDAASDVAAARAAGMRAGLLLDRRRCELCPLRSEAALPCPDRAAPRLDLLAEEILTGPRG